MREQRGLTSFRTDITVVSSPAFSPLSKAVSSVGKGTELSLQRSRVQLCMGHLASHGGRLGSKTCLNAIAWTSHASAKGDPGMRNRYNGDQLMSSVFQALF